MFTQTRIQTFSSSSSDRQNPFLVPILMINISCFIILLALATLNQFSAHQLTTIVFYRHLIKTLLGLVLLTLVFFIKDSFLEKSIPPLYVVNIFLLVFVLTIGTTVKGATRWLTVGSMTFQPSEITKIVVPLMCSQIIFHSRNCRLSVCVGLNLIAVIIPALLIAKQPDLGSAILVLFSGLAPLALLNIPFRYYLYTIILFTFLSPLGWKMLHPYQQQRVQTLLMPKEDLQGSGYHIHQSKIAIGSGGLLGKGWQQNSQAFLGYLPEADTDFAFALYAEERGFVISALTIALMYVFYMTLIWLSLTPSQERLKILCFSLAAPQFLYCFINIAMVSGLIPVVGVPLPFFSRGGSNFMIHMMTLGCIYRYIEIKRSDLQEA